MLISILEIACDIVQNAKNVGEKIKIEKVSNMVYLVPKNAIQRVNFHDFNFVKPKLRDYLDHVSYYKYDPKNKSTLRNSFELNVKYDIDKDKYL